MLQSILGRLGRIAPIYAFATENLDYMGRLVAPGGRVLTIGASGDQVIEACRAGASKVTAVEVKDRARQWFDFKESALAALAREDFLKLTMRGPEAFSGTPLKLAMAGLSRETASFWRGALAGAGGGGVLRAGALFQGRHDTVAHKMLCCPYLRGVAAYAEASDALGAASDAGAIAWVTARFEEWIQGAPEQATFDCVALSNLADHSHSLCPGPDHVTAFRDAFVLPSLARIAPGGRCMLGYAYDADNRHGSEQRNPFNDPDVRRTVYGSVPGWSLREIRVPSALGDGGEDAAVVLDRAA